jgi:hypothetical protein
VIAAVWIARKPPMLEPRSAILVESTPSSAASSLIMRSASPIAAGDIAPSEAPCPRPS